VPERPVNVRETPLILIICADSPIVTDRWLRA
jgi:hypothetical protein